MKNSALISLLALSPAADAFVVVPRGGRMTRMGSTPFNTHLSMAVEDAPEGTDSELLTKLERAGDMMKEAVMSRLPTEEPEAVKTSEETEKLLESAVAEVKEAVAEIEEAVGAAPEPKVANAVAELEEAVADLKEAIDTDVDKLLATGETELEKAIADLEDAVESETLVASVKPEEAESVAEVKTSIEEAVENEVGTTVASAATEVESTAVESETLVAAITPEAAEIKSESLVASTTPEAINKEAESTMETTVAEVKETVENEAGTLLAQLESTATEVDGGSLVDSVEKVLQASASVVDAISSMS